MKFQGACCCMSTLHGPRTVMRVGRLRVLIQKGRYPMASSIMIYLCTRKMPSAYGDMMLCKKDWRQRQGDPQRHSSLLVVPGKECLRRKEHVGGHFAAWQEAGHVPPSSVLPSARSDLVSISAWRMFHFVCELKREIVKVHCHRQCGKHFCHPCWREMLL